MQTITGKLRMVGQSNIVPLAVLSIQERLGSNLAGNIIASTTTDAGGNFSFQIRPGSYFLVYGNDRIAFRVTATVGSTTIDKLVETL